MSNFSIITEFLLMEFSSVHELQVLHAVLFLMIYLAALMGKLLTMAVIINDPQLHCPMYFFLSNLSLLDICAIIVMLPKFIVNSLSGIQSLSVLDCVAQFFFFGFFVTAEFALLVTMLYGRYVAICQPLKLWHHHESCPLSLGSIWLLAQGLIYSTVNVGNMFQLPFYGSNVIHQFFCDSFIILKVSAPDVIHSESVLMLPSLILFLCCFAFLISSYFRIFSTVLKIPSVVGCYKAISTSSLQLIILILFVISIILTFLIDTSDASPIQNLLIAATYSTFPPVMNPIIHSLRKQNITAAMGKMIRSVIFFPHA